MAFSDSGIGTIDLLRQSGETIAARMEYIDMDPLNILETSTEEEPYPSKTFGCTAVSRIVIWRQMMKIVMPIGGILSALI